MKPSLDKWIIKLEWRLERIWKVFSVVNVLVIKHDFYK